MRKVRFYASPLFVEHRWTWRGLRAFPHPTIVKLGDGVYFGHPVTIARARQEIEMEAYATGRKTKRTAPGRENPLGYWESTTTDVPHRKN